MEDSLTADQVLFQETTRRFLTNETPLTKVRALSETSSGFELNWWRRGAELGWTSLLVSEEKGGGSISGYGLLDLAIVAEEMGRLVSPGPLLVTNVVASALAEASTAQNHAAALAALVSGTAVASWAIYEPGHGWDPEHVELRADADARHYFLNGVKDRVESADQSDYLLVTARAGQQMAQFLVPSNLPGLTITPSDSVDLVRRIAEVRFDHVRVPAAAMVGTTAEAPAAVERQFQIAVALQCAEMVGALDRVFQFTLQWMFDRYSFGRPLASYQALKHRFADMKLWLEASHATASAALRAVQSRAENASELVSVAKAYIGVRATDVVQECVQMHGGIGITWDHDLHLYLRRVAVDRLSWGTPSEHRMRLASILDV